MTSEDLQQLATLLKAVQDAEGREQLFFVGLASVVDTDGKEYATVTFKGNDEHEVTAIKA